METRKRHKIKMEMESMSPSAELPLSLIESDILPRLAAKTVGRCMCVCKHWKSFLSTPMFARAYIKHHNYHYKLLIHDGAGANFRTLDDDGGSSTIPNPNPDPTTEFVVASLDGLVCLASCKPVNLAFWNPLTGAYKKLSSRPWNSSKLIDDDVIGFYTDSSNDYKLLYLIWGGCFGAYIYSHRLDSWREIEYSFGYNKDLTCSQASLCGDCLYFTVTSNIDQTDSWVVICFDVNTESFREIQFPLVLGGVRDYDYCASLVVLNGCLHLFVSYHDYSWSKRKDLWRMNGDGDGWVNVATFRDTLLTLDTDFTRLHICTPITAGNWLVVFDHQHNCFKKINAEDFTKQYRYLCSPTWKYRSIMYVETLVSPNP